MHSPSARVRETRTKHEDSQIGGGLAAVIISTVMIVIFGYVLPTLCVHIFLLTLV